MLHHQQKPLEITCTLKACMDTCKPELRENMEQCMVYVNHAGKLDIWDSTIFLDENSFSTDDS